MLARAADPAVTRRAAGFITGVKDHSLVHTQESQRDILPRRLPRQAVEEPITGFVATGPGARGLDGKPMPFGTSPDVGITIYTMPVPQRPHSVDFGVIPAMPVLAGQQEDRTLRERVTGFLRSLKPHK